MHERVLQLRKKEGLVVYECASGSATHAATINPNKVLHRASLDDIKAAKKGKSRDAVQVVGLLKNAVRICYKDVYSWTQGNSQCVYLLPRGYSYGMAGYKAGETGTSGGTTGAVYVDTFGVASDASFQARKEHAVRLNRLLRENMDMFLASQEAVSAADQLQDCNMKLKATPLGTLLQLSVGDTNTQNLFDEPDLRDDLRFANHWSYPRLAETGVVWLFVNVITDITVGADKYIITVSDDEERGAHNWNHKKLTITSPGVYNCGAKLREVWQKKTGRTQAAGTEETEATSVEARVAFGNVVLSEVLSSFFNVVSAYASKGSTLEATANQLAPADRKSLDGVSQEVDVKNFDELGETIKALDGMEEHGWKWKVFAELSKCGVGVALGIGTGGATVGHTLVSCGPIASTILVETVQMLSGDQGKNKMSDSLLQELGFTLDYVLELKEVMSQLTDANCGNAETQVPAVVEKAMGAMQCSTRVLLEYKNDGTIHGEPANHVADAELSKAVHKLAKYREMLVHGVQVLQLDLQVKCAAAAGHLEVAVKKILRRVKNLHSAMKTKAEEKSRATDAGDALAAEWGAAAGRAAAASLRHPRSRG